MTNALQQEKKIQQLPTVVQSPIAENPADELSEMENHESGSSTKPTGPFEAPLSPILPPTQPTALPSKDPATATITGGDTAHPVAIITDGEYAQQNTTISTCGLNAN